MSAAFDEVMSMQECPAWKGSAQPLRINNLFGVKAEMQHDSVIR